MLVFYERIDEEGEKVAGALDVIDLESFADQMIEFLDESPDANIPREFDVRNWITFLPPLHPIKIVGLQNIGPTFQAALNNELKTGNPAQFQRMAVLYGKMTLFSLQIQELIQRAVNKSVLLLSTKRPTNSRIGSLGSSRKDSFHDLTQVKSDPN